ncbi:MAG: glycosyltransferase family 87 protein, partial [Vulcanimicrobiaceae bacterium]
MRAARFALAAIAVACALLFARPHSTPGPAMRDFEAYYAAGRTWSHGGNPYGSAIWNAERRIPGVDPHRYEVLPFVGPPATLPLWGLLARLPFASAVAVWGAVLGASLAVVILVTLRLLEMRVTPLAFGTLLLAALAFGPVTSGIALGQVVLPAFASALLALAWLERNALAAGVATVVAA